jgi:hypothetical protein
MGVTGVGSQQAGWSLARGSPSVLLDLVRQADVAAQSALLEMIRFKVEHS